MTSSVPVTQKYFPDGTLRRSIRHLALDGLSTFGAINSSTNDSMSRNRVHFLYFHFLPTSDISRFRTLIRELGATHRFISYSDAVNRLKYGPIDAPYLALSFDDGFLSNVGAARVLHEEGISACFFVCPGLIGQDRQELLRTFPTSLGHEQRAMNWNQVEGLLRIGHEVGSHTMTHPVLAEQSTERAKWEIAESRSILTTRLGTSDHFAWPRGQFHHFSPELVADVYANGYLSCASAVRGAHSVIAARGQDLCIRRENVVTSWPARHVKYFMARSARRMSEADNEFPAQLNSPPG